MKILSLLLIAVTAVFACRHSMNKSWKEIESDEYIINKSNLIYETDDLYIFRQPRRYVLIYEKGEFHHPYIAAALPGVIESRNSRIVFDSSRFDLTKVKAYFSNYFNKKIR